MLRALSFGAKDETMVGQARAGAEFVIRRFPERELKVRRLCKDSEDFRTLCDDYSEAVTARRRFETRYGKHHKWTEDYRVMIVEFEVELERALMGNTSVKRKSGIL